MSDPFGPPDREIRSDQNSLCALLYAILAGEQASEVLSGGRDLTALYGACLPQFSFGLADLGNRAATAASPRMPYRVTSLDEAHRLPLVVTVGETLTLRVDVKGFKQQFTRQIHLAADSGHDASRMGRDLGFEQTYRLVPVTAGWLQQIKADGIAARWALHQQIEKSATALLERSVGRRLREAADAGGFDQIAGDQIAIDAMRDRLLLGDLEHPGLIETLIGALVDVSKVPPQDPVMLLNGRLRRDVARGVDRVLGDTERARLSRRSGVQAHGRQWDFQVGALRANLPLREDG